MILDVFIIFFRTFQMPMIRENTENRLIDLKSMDLQQLTRLMSELNYPAFRAKQIFKWLSRGANDFSEMRNIPADLRKHLKEIAEIKLLDIADIQCSSDGTRKYLFRLNDGNFVESVFMKYRYGNSLCISSQVGCRMGCAFCASTLNGHIRNLSAGEMLDQIFQVSRDTEEYIGNVVVMGIGEPFDNYENLSGFIGLANAATGLNLGMRNITVSTCGVVPKISEFAEDFPQVNLAISLHAANDIKRSALMPVNRIYPLEELMRACREYTDKTHRRITFEYALIAGETDTDECASELIKLLKGMLCHVNLIPLNEVREVGKISPTRGRITAFAEKLEQGGINTTVRRSLGSDISAACGQLRNARTKNNYDPDMID